MDNERKVIIYNDVEDLRKFIGAMETLIEAIAIPEAFEKSIEKENG